MARDKEKELKFICHNLSILDLRIVTLQSELKTLESEFKDLLKKKYKLIKEVEK